MNIGQMVRGLLGDVKAGDSKQLELKSGQVVRGVVMQVSDDGQEAVMNIQGVQVKAKLESPLQPGQTTMLQVQPEMSNGLVVLKPLESSPYVPVAEQSLGEVLKSFGLPDQKWAKDLVQLMQKTGVPLTKENIETLKAIVLQQPQGIANEEWIQAAAVAFKRGLPLTQETVQSLHQALFGKPLTELLTKLQSQLADALAGRPAASGPAAAQPAAARGEHSAPLPQGGAGAGANAPTLVGGARAGAAPLLLTQAAAVLQELAAAVKPAAEAALPARAGAPSAGAGTAAAPATPAASPAGAMPGGAAQQAAPATAPGQPAAQPPLAAQSQPVPPGAAPANASATGTTPPASALSSVMQQPVPAASEGSAFAAAASASTTAASDKAAAQPPPSQPSQSSASQLAQPAPAQTWIANVLKLLGVEHEQLTWKTVDPGRSQMAAAPGGTADESGAVQSSVPSQQAANAAGGAKLTHLPIEQIIRPEAGLAAANQSGSAAPLAHHTAAQESLKNVLMQLIQSDEAPAALKETAQQLVHQITGQQLLLSTDRSSHFAHVSLFIPLTTPDGDQTATVHIQTRKGKRGELDASNCHLWFDLNLKALGRTIADVQVVDKIVSLKFHNDQPWLNELILDQRPEFTKSLENIGYQLISLQTGPIPQSAQASESASGAVFSESLAAFAPSAYKGVDVRV